MRSLRAPRYGMPVALTTLALTLSLSGCTESPEDEVGSLSESGTDDATSQEGDGDGDPAGDGDGDASGDGDGDPGDGDGDPGDGDGDPGDGDGDPGDGDGDPGDGDGDPGDGDGDPGDGDGDPGDGDGDIGDGDGDIGDGDGDDEEPAVCGDGVLGPGEPCDDGNDIPDDGCESDCTHSVDVAWTWADDECSALTALEWLGTGDIVGSGVLLVATWDPETGEQLAAQRQASSYEDISVTADGVIAVGATPGDDPIGGVWRYNSDLELLWSVDAADLGQDPAPESYISVVALPDEGAVVLDIERNVMRLDGNGELLNSVEFPYGGGLLVARMRNMVLVGDEVWVLYHFDNSVQVYARVVRYDSETLENVGETFWEVSQGPTYHFRSVGEIVHLDGRTVVTGDTQDLDNPNNGFGLAAYWEFDMNGALIETRVLPSVLGTPNWPPGMGLTAGGSFAVADKGNAYAVGAQGELLWRVDAAAYSQAFISNMIARDALLRDGEDVYLGGYYNHNNECSRSSLLRLNW